MDKSKSQTGPNLNVSQIKSKENESDHSTDTNDSNNNNTLVLNKTLSTAAKKPLLQKEQHLRTPSTRSKKYLLMRRKESEWEIIEGLKTGQTFNKIPESYSGFLHKQRKWPLKGWHKRFFVLENGILTYAKTTADFRRGKIHGTIDIGMSVISTKEDGCRLDIDTEEFIYHMKAKTIETFRCWAEKLKDHRLYRQHVLIYGYEPAACNSLTTGAANSTALNTRNQSIVSGNFSNDISDINMEQAQADFQHLEKCYHELINLYKDNEIENMSNSSRKSVKKSSLRRKQISLTFSTNSSNDTVDTNGSKSNTNSAITKSKLSDSSSSLASSATDQNVELKKLKNTEIAQRKDDFLIISTRMLEVMKKLFDKFFNERKRLKSICDMEQQNRTTSNLETVVTLRSNLERAIKFNGELKEQLNKIHQWSNVNDLNVDFLPLDNSSCETNETEFYDAESGPNTITDVATTVSNSNFTIVPITENNSESSSIDSLSSEDVECSLSSNDNHSSDSVQGLGQSSGDQIYVNKPIAITGRRKQLPAPRLDTEGLSLWNILCKNIGKDLTQISMPVCLNEPLNTLQKLCEELEYCELIDKAADCTEPIEQMVYIASFVVSAYANSQYRAASKPFNPLLGETYECIREDKGFRFMSEQVSHHPPISVCHAKSNNFEFWQDIRVKSKFWGKSMEIQPIGFANLYLPKTKTYYKWNKVTTCIHNLFNNNKRWVDQYGELTITNKTQHIICNLTFVKASYWSSKRHEFYGNIVQSDGTISKKLFGRWSEGVYFDEETKCVWKPNQMPENYDIYYGFSQFAMELNELTDDLREFLPITDTRFRPDQRALEEGRIEDAERLKTQLELKQRERRKENERFHVEVKPRWFLKDYGKDDEEFWRFSCEYWEHRKNKTFNSLKIDPLW